MQFIVPIDRGSQLPVYKQISAGIRQSILSGRVSAGERLPSTREMAQLLGLNRLTVVKSYEELLKEGFIETIVGAGTFISRNAAGALELSFQPPQQQPSRRNGRGIRLSSYAQRLSHCQPDEADPDHLSELNYGAPRVDELPIERWQQLLSRSTRTLRSNLLAKTNDPLGYAPLREAIAHYLRRARCANCTSEQVIVFSQPTAGADLISRLFVEPGDTVAVENPGFPLARRTLTAHGANVVGVGVDAEGLKVPSLYGLDADVKLIYVTPSHHDPTGAVLSLPRRFELLRWAATKGAVIVEDDYDSEYRYGEEPAQALQGLDTEGHVIYRYNFWKVLFPLVKLGFLVVPPHLVSLFRRAKQLLDGEMSLLEQDALATFIANGHFERHIRRTRAIYARRRAMLIQALTIHFGKSVYISPTSAGMHVLVHLNGEWPTDDHILSCARQAKLPLVSTRASYVGDSVKGEFLAGFAQLEEEDIKQTVAQFAGLLGATAPIVSRPAESHLSSGFNANLQGLLSNL